MNLIQEIQEKSSKLNKHIVLPEGDDSRMLPAAAKLVNNKICRVTIIGDENKLQKEAQKQKISLDGVNIINPGTNPKRQEMAQEYFHLRKHKGVTEEQAFEQVSDPLYCGAMMLRSGEVDGNVAGALNTTGNVLRAAIQCVGLAEGISVVSSSFLMLVPGWDQPLTYADAGVVPDPNSKQLASIAISSAKTHKKLTGIDPVVAMLSFSTKGSAKHAVVDKVIEATRLAKEQAPELKIDGELQADAALIPAIGAKKAPESDVAGQANVLVFPDLAAGNIAYKLTERLAKAHALGPLVQGLKRPAMDLSRGCSVEDVVNVAAICCLLGE